MRGVTITAMKSERNAFFVYASNTHKFMNMIAHSIGNGAGNTKNPLYSYKIHRLWRLIANTLHPDFNFIAVL